MVALDRHGEPLLNALTWADLRCAPDVLTARRELDEDAIYRASGVLDFRRDSTPSTAYSDPHGAAVALLAAGFAPQDPAGRDHPLIAVNLPPRITEDSMGTLAPVSILASILFIITRARRWGFTAAHAGCAAMAYFTA